MEVCVNHRLWAVKERAQPKVYPEKIAGFCVTPETLVCSLKPRLITGSFK